MQCKHTNRSKNIQIKQISLKVCFLNMVATVSCDTGHRPCPLVMSPSPQESRWVSGWAFCRLLWPPCPQTWSTVSCLDSSPMTVSVSYDYLIIVTTAISYNTFLTEHYDYTHLIIVTTAISYNTFLTERYVNQYQPDME